ncbi:hypothetical protein BC829DRAFT_394773, partial [Chytridium lagenaria]
DGDEPSISFAANDYLSGLPNLRKSRVQSALNSTFQVFLAVPEMTEELPFSSSSESTRRFVTTVKYVHCNATKVAEADKVDMDWWRELSSLPSSSDSPEDDLIESIADYEKLSRSLLDYVLGPSRIGRRFVSERKMDIPPTPKPISASTSSIGPTRKDSFTFSASKFSASSLVNNNDGCAAAAEKDKGSTGNLCLGDSPHMVTLPLHDYTETIQSIAPTPLSRPRSGSISKPTAATPTVRFTRLPELLVLSFKRPLTLSGVYHRTAVEMPMDLDLGFALDRKAAKVIEHGGKERSTFYKLHGFFGGFKWFKCEDEVVAEADLGARVASKGVLLALYRLQEKKH